MWYNNAIFYHIYPLGYTGSPFNNDGQYNNRLKKIEDNIPYLKDLGIDAIYFGPIFKSVSHGYDTSDYYMIDNRLGNNDDFKSLANSLHQNGLKFIVDGVFNHVGRDFFAFKDVLNNRQNSPYVDWFYINFDGNSPYNDGFYYEGWEGHYELVKLNLRNGDVKRHIFDAIRMWFREFDIDGLRLDVAYCLDHDFLRELRNLCKSIKADCFLLGEALFGDYKLIANSEMLDSVTNYECYKGVYSSLNSYNMFEISYAYNRQSSKENWAMYPHLNLYNFVDNHDVSRIASALCNPNHLKLAYVLMYFNKGIPSIYYASESGILGNKSDGDQALRLPFEENKNDMYKFIKNLNHIYHMCDIVSTPVENILVTNRQYMFKRGQYYILINIDENEASFNLNGRYLDLETNQECEINGISLPSYGYKIYKQA